MSKLTEAITLAIVGAVVVMFCLALFAWLVSLMGQVIASRTKRQKMVPATAPTGITKETRNQPQIAAITAVLSTLIDVDKIKSITITKKD
ncbi:MAG: OadG family protein [Limnochordia bacterium]|jgi:Na+-transporting methylmalonyl-CoA/oxaloacetate decarboxylase gamma subunit|nr:OadG family protein [Limnochordia bacterium]MDD4517989.1 OadG family protein [Limnochordia bacterium]